MADEQQTGQAEQATHQSSSTSASQSSTGADNQSANTSSSSTSKPAESAQAERPAWATDSYWDAKAGLKSDALAKDLTELPQLRAFKATEDSRRLTLPQKAEDFAFELPADFKPPQGVEFKLNPDDQRVAEARAFALKAGLDKDQFKQLVGIYAAGEVKRQMDLQAFETAEVGKLGVNGTARKTAVDQWLSSRVSPQLAEFASKTMKCAAHVELFEKLMADFRSQGSGTFTQNGRELPPANGKIQGYEGMTFEQRRQAQDQRVRAANGR